MRLKTILILGGLCALGSGCSPLFHWSRTAGREKGEYVQCENVTESRCSNKLSETAWEQVRLANPEVPYSADFADGFKKGFAEHLQTGKSEPPALPPPCYGPLAYGSIEGRQAVLDWFRGFHLGTVEAQASALRPVATLPPVVDIPDRGVRRAEPVAVLPRAGQPELLPMPELVDKPPQDAATGAVQGGHCPL